MYSVYVDGKILYATMLSSSGYDIYDAVYTCEINKSGSFSFTVPKTNPMYSEIYLRNSTVTVMHDINVVWQGRPIDVTSDFYNNQVYTCEGELSLLREILYDYTTRTKLKVKALFDELLSSYNEKRGKNSAISDEEKKKLFIIGDDDFDASASFGDTSITISSELRRSILDVILEEIVDVFGGFLKVVYTPQGERQLKYYANSEKSGKKSIIYGRNLLNLEKFYDDSEFFTRLWIYGAKTEDGSRVTLRSGRNSEYLDINDTRIFDMVKSRKNLYYGIDRDEADAMMADYGVIEKTMICE